MLGLGSSTLGLALIVLGLVFILVAPVARLVARLGQTTRTTFTPPVINIEIPRNDNALIVIRPGGQVAYLNENARQWFGLLEDEEPNLERLGRATRPIEDFMNLCAVSGRARFTLQQTLVEGYSYEAPYQEEKAMLVTLQRPKLTGLEGGGKEFSNQAVRILTDISQAMTASLDLEIAITTVLESVDRLIPFDFA